MSARVSPEIGVGVIGLGFMGGTHVRAYQAATSAGFPCRLVAVCDSSPALIAGDLPIRGNIALGSSASRLLDPSRVRGTQNLDEIINARDIQLLSICTYTDSHVDLAIRALRAGKHVLVEKPVATNSADVQRLAQVASESNGLCMPAMCMRFWPGWDWLHDRIVDQRFGQVRSATFQRLGSQPSWATDFYGDVNRSGGALLDLHIHDVDFIHWCFGAPDDVRSAGTLQHLTTQYRFANGPDHVVAEAGWDLHPNAGFRMRYLVNFEHASAEFNLSRTTPLLVHDATGSRAIELPPMSGYDGEIRHMLEAITRGTLRRVTLDDAVAVMRTLEAERRSIERGR